MTHLFIGNNIDLLSDRIRSELQTQYPDIVLASHKSIEEVNHPDLHLLVTKDGESLGIEPLRNFFAKLHKKPFKAPQQIGVIIGFDLATPEAQNASLKELEEHSASVHFYLAATEESLLLPTIKSRATIHFVQGSADKKSKKEISDLATEITSEKTSVSGTYLAINTKEWTRLSVTELLHECHVILMQNGKYEKLPILQKCSEYLGANVSPKHVALYLFFALSQATV